MTLAILSGVTASVSCSMLVHTWQQMNYRMAVCRVTHGAHIETINRNLKRCPVIS